MNKSKYLLLIIMLVIIVPTSIILAQSSTSFTGQIVPTPTPIQLPTPLPEINTYGQTAQFSFADLDEETFVMRYPSFKDIYIQLPNEWSLVGGEGYSYIELHYDFFESEQEETVNPTPHPLYARYPFISKPGVEIYFNNTLIYVFIPQVGKNNIIQVPISDVAIFPSSENPFNDNQIRIGYYDDADIYCDFDGVLTIHKDSFVNTVFGIQPPYRVLSSLPRPMIADSFIPETLKLIIPDIPSSNDIEAIAIITSSIAHNSYSTVEYDVIRASEITTADLERSNAIVIGTPADNKFLADLYKKQLLPSGLSANGKDILQSGADTIGENDGVLQIIPSDVNQYKSFLAITGESGIAVLRAAYAFDELPLFPPPFLLVVTDAMLPNTIEEQNEIEILQTKYTYAEFGYTDRIRYGVGLQRFYLTFYIPRDWVLDHDLELTVNYAHSDTIDAHSSNVAVLLNNDPVGNLVLAESPSGEQTIVIPIRKENVRKGMANVIQFNAVLTADLVCEDYNPNAYWFKVAEDSTLDIPHHITTSPTEISPVINPIVPFAFETKHLVILGSNPTKEQLNTFANLYSQYGNLNRAGNFDVLVSLEDTINLDAYPDRNIMMIGLPTTSDLIEQVNSKLPQPFIAGTDDLQQNIANTAYQLVPGSSIGVVESIPASWNYARAITIITGTSPEGLQWSSQQFIADSGQYLIGDLFFIQNSTVTSFISTLFSQPVLDAMVSEALQEEELVPVETTAEDDTVVTGLTGEYIREEDVNQSTTPMFLMGVIGILGLVFIIYLASRITSGGRKS